MYRNYQDPAGRIKLWWLIERDEDLPQAIVDHAKYLMDVQQTRLAALRHHTRMYSGRLMANMSGAAFSDAADLSEKIRLNATKSAVDAALAQIATARPRPKRRTVDGTWAERKRAERLDRFSMGWFHKLQQYILSLDIFMDAEIGGTGLEKFVASRGQIMAERTLADEIFVDETEARVVSPGSHPATMLQIKHVPRSTLIARLPKMEEKIRQAECLDPETAGSYQGVEDPVTVIEAWHLAQRADGKDGRHAIVLSNAVIKNEPWKFNKPPFSAFRWNNAALGYFGVGLVEEVAPLQLELNYVAHKMQRAMTLATTIVAKKQGVGMKRITNELGGIYEVGGDYPQVLQVSPLPAEWVSYSERLYQRIFEIAGVSQMQAQAQKPSGLYSGDAIRLFHDVTTRRFQHTEQRWAQFQIDASEQILDRAREIAGKGGAALRVLAAGDKEVEEIDWSDVAMDRDQYVTEVHPTSIVPDTPSGQVELMTTLSQVAMNLGPDAQRIVGSMLIQTLSGIPDLQASVRRMNAPHELAERMVSNIMEYGQYEPPDPSMGGEALAAIRSTAQAELLNAPRYKLPEERVSLLRRLMDAVDGAQAGAAMMGQMGLDPAAMGGMPGMPGAGPGAGMQLPPMMSQPPLPGAA